MKRKILSLVAVLLIALPLVIAGKIITSNIIITRVYNASGNVSYHEIYYKHGNTTLEMESVFINYYAGLGAYNTDNHSLETHSYIGNCSGDLSCDDVTYDSELSYTVDTTIGNCSGLNTCNDIIYNNNLSSLLRNETPANFTDLYVTDNSYLSGSIGNDTFRTSWSELNSTTDLSNLVPYIGATTNTDLGNNSIINVSSYNTLSILPVGDWIYLSGDGSIEEGLDISIPKYAGRNFYYGYGGAESHYFGNAAELTIASNGDLITAGNVDIGGITTLSNGAVATPSISFKDNAGSGIFLGGGHSLGFSTGGVERLELDNVEATFTVPAEFKTTVEVIGTTGASFKAKTTSGTPQEIRVQAGGTSPWFGTMTVHDLRLVAGLFLVMTLKTDGKVGIGTANPTSKLHVVGSVNITEHLYINDTLKFIPIDTPPIACDDSTLGSMYFDISEDQTCTCTSDGWRETDAQTASCT